jgi:hypothetical protein
LLPCQQSKHTYGGCRIPNLSITNTTFCKQHHPAAGLLATLLYVSIKPLHVRNASSTKHGDAITLSVH